MSKFYFNENIAANVSSGLNDTANNVSSIRKNLSAALIQLEMCDGFDIVSSYNNIKNEMTIMEGISEKADKGKGVMKLVSAAVQKYEKLASVRYCAAAQGNLGSEFDKYKKTYNDFMKTEVDATLYAKTTFTQLTKAGKMSLEEMGKDILNGDLLGVFDNNTAEVYEKYYIAKYMEQMYDETVIPDIGDDIETLDKIVKYMVDNPNEIGQADLLSAFNINSSSNIGKFITNSSSVFETANMALKGYKDKMKLTEYVMGAIRTQYVDYSKMAEVAGNMKDLLSTYYVSDSNTLEVVNELYNKYTMDSNERLVSYLKDAASKEIAGEIYKNTLGKITGLVDIASDLVYDTNSDVGALLEMRYTSDLVYGLEKSYEELSKIINSGNYTSENLQQFSEAHQLLKELYAYRYEEMAVISGNQKYNDMAEEIKAMSLNITA